MERKQTLQLIWQKIDSLILFLITKVFTKLTKTIFNIESILILVLRKQIWAIGQFKRTSKQYHFLMGMN